MDTNITFEFEASEIMDRVDGEISRHASFLRFQDGGSAYDSLVVHTNDRPRISEFVADAFRTVQATFFGECTYREHTRGYVLGFFLPDFDIDTYHSTKDELERYISLSSTSRWLGVRSFPEFSQMIAKDAETSLNRAVTMLRTRKFPIE